MNYSQSNSITQLLQRKQNILLELENFRKELLEIEKPKKVLPIELDSTNTSKYNSTEDIRTQIQAKETLQKEMDQLKLQNEKLVQEASQAADLEARLAIANRELELLKQNYNDKMVENNNLIQQIDGLDSTVSALKEELLSTQKLLQQARLDLSAQNGEVSIARKMNNAERQAMASQQQGLVLELEKLKADQAKYQNLIQSIESAVSSGKICLVSARGLSVTTMMDLAIEINNEKKMKKYFFLYCILSIFHKGNTDRLLAGSTATILQ